MFVENSDASPLNRKIGYELMGPVIHRWLMGLHQYMSYFDDGDTSFLFCARAGVRIKALYEEFVKGAGLKSTTSADMFWMSRVAIAKGVFNRSRDVAVEHISREYHHHPLSELVQGLLRHQSDRLSTLDLSRNELKAHGYNFGGWIQSDQDAALALRHYLAECTSAFDGYLQGLLGERKRAVLIDSGWQGSAQSMLASAYPDIDWQGLYFGRILTPDHDAKIVGKVIGIMFEANEFDKQSPITALVRHRHVIETLLEPNAPSIEEVPGHGDGTAAKALIDKNCLETPDPNSDSLYLHVLDYIRDNAPLSLIEIEANYQAVTPLLARILVNPSREEALAFYCKERSADFGKSLSVPVLIDPEESGYADSDQRIAASLWPEGQIALEYSGKIAADIQQRVSGQTDNQSYFDPHGAAQARGAAGLSALLPQKPKVAIITRTKNRPLLLERAARSVACQLHDEYEWVIVNDGGDETAVRDVIANCAVDRRKITLVSNSESLGMEAASNVGVKNSSSDYVVIHDDDDSWAPGFLQKTVGYLEGAAGRRYGGVITHSLYVSEEIRGDSVIEHGRHPYQDWVRNVQLSEMAAGNFFAPIAFVYRRKVWDDIGGYNEELPVLGDWYFNMEFLLRADIGVIPEPLAYYHHRDRGDSRTGIYANSVIGGISKHEEFTSIARNEFVRKNLADHPAAASVLLGYNSNLVRESAGMLRSHINEVSGKVESFRVHEKPTNEQESARNGFQRRWQQELADKYWAVAQINLFAANHSSNRYGRTFWKKGGSPEETVSPIDPESSWEEIECVLFQMGKVAVPENFRESEYLHFNPDVEEAVRNGDLPSGYFHYLTHGRKEGRARPGEIH